VLQQGLRTKQPMCIFAMLGGEQGAKLTRAAFSVILKFSDKIEVFTKLIELVDKLSNDLQVSSS